jgi:hypothetical protein
MPSPAWVTLFAADDAPKRADSNEYTHEVAQLFADDETGKFVFRQVRSGRYVVAFQPGDPPDMDLPYWPRFYPSAKDRKNAEVIEIAEGQKITDLEFKIGDEVARPKVFVRAIWQDGTAAESVHLQLRNSKNAKAAGRGHHLGYLFSFSRKSSFSRPAMHFGNSQFHASAPVSRYFLAAAKCYETTGVLSLVQIVRA